MNFAFIPFILLIIPIVEIGAFITIGGQIGIIPTLLMILVTAIIGSFLLRIQGLSILRNAQQKMAKGEIPGQALGDGMMIIIAGILLLTPGFVTDTLGFLLFVPFIRAIIWKFITARIKTVPLHPSSFHPSTQPSATNQEDVIDLDADEYKTQSHNPNSPWNKD